MANSTSPSTSTKEIYSLIDRLEAKLNDRSAGVKEDVMFKSYNYRSMNNNSGKYYEDQLTKTPYQQLLQSNYYQRDIGEPSRNMSFTSEYEIRKLIKEEFDSMMIPYQQDINKTISVMEMKLDSIEVLKGNKCNEQLPSSSSSSSLLSNQIDKLIETKVKEIQKDFDSKLEEQTNIINQLTKSKKESEEKNEQMSNDTGAIKEIEAMKANIEKMSNEIKEIKEGNYNELKSLNTKGLRLLDCDQMSKCDFKTLNTIDLYQLKEMITQPKESPVLLDNKLISNTNTSTNTDDKVKELTDITTELNKKVNESLDIANSLKNLKLNDKLTESSNQITQLQSHITELQSSIDSIKSTSSFNSNTKPQSSGIGFDEMNKINQQIIGLKQQVNSMQSKQSFFIEASALEVVSADIKKKLNANEYHDTIAKLKKDNEDLTQAITDLKTQLKENKQSIPLQPSFDKEKEDLIKTIESKIASLPNQDALDDETKKISQLENRIFILENAEKDTANKDDIKMLLDEVDKINERLNDLDSNNNNKGKGKDKDLSGIKEILSNVNVSSQPAYKEEPEPFIITNLPMKEQSNLNKKKSPFAMAEEDDMIINEHESNNQDEFAIETASKGKGDTNEFKTSEEHKDNKDNDNGAKPKKEHDPDDFDDFEIDEIEELN